MPQLSQLDIMAANPDKECKSRKKDPQQNRLKCVAENQAVSDKERILCGGGPEE